MGLFKSKEERRIERNLEVRKALTQIRRQIKDSEKYETNYVAQAKRARKLGATTQYEFLKKAIKKTLLMADWIAEVRTQDLENRYHIWAGAVRRTGEELGWLVDALACVARASGWPRCKVARGVRRSGNRGC